MDSKAGRELLRAISRMHIATGELAAVAEALATTEPAKPANEQKAILNLAKDKARAACVAAVELAADHEGASALADGCTQGIESATMPSWEKFRNIKDELTRRFVSPFRIADWLVFLESAGGVRDEDCRAVFSGHVRPNFNPNGTPNFSKTVDPVEFETDFGDIAKGEIRQRVDGPAIKPLIDSIRDSMRRLRLLDMGEQITYRHVWGSLFDVARQLGIVVNWHQFMDVSVEELADVLEETEIEIESTAEENAEWLGPYEPKELRKMFGVSDFRTVKERVGESRLRKTRGRGYLIEKSAMPAR